VEHPTVLVCLLGLGSHFLETVNGRADVAQSIEDFFVLLDDSCYFIDALLDVHRNAGTVACAFFWATSDPDESLVVAQVADSLLVSHRQTFGEASETPSLFHNLN
jgi:hypothetical protein